MESGQKRLYSLDQVQFYAQSLDSIKTLDKPTLVDVHRNIQGKNYTDPEVFSIIAKSILKKHF